MSRPRATARCVVAVVTLGLAALAVVGPAVAQTQIAPVTLAGSIETAPPARPHIVFLLADDLGWGDVGFHGSEIPTPSLDALAKAGTELAAHYAQPVCTASRAALMTGRYPMRQGLQAGAIKPWSSFGLPLEETTLAQSLAEAGYATALVGKWHLGHHEPAYLPTRRGFDHHYGHYNDAIDYFAHTCLGSLDWHRDLEPVREEGYATRLLAREAQRIIAEHDPAQPLFLVVAFNAPHTPLQVPAEDLARVAGVASGRRATYAAMVSVLDEGVGGILRALDEKGMRRDTFLVFTSDNGANPLQGGSNRPLRGGKTALYEGGIRVPTIVQWPERIAAGGSIAVPVHLVDWAPTLLALAGAQRRSALPLDGVDLGLLLQGRIPGLPVRNLLLNVGYRASALRFGRYKIVRTLSPPMSSVPFQTELFDLSVDAGEDVDLSATYPERRAALERQLDWYVSQAIPAATESAASRRRPPGWNPPPVWGDFPDASSPSPSP